VAAGRLSRPGTKHGPCQDLCQHLDCALVRADAERLCTYCGKRIGFEVRFYDATVPGVRADMTPQPRLLAHALCLEVEAERQSERRKKSGRPLDGVCGKCGGFTTNGERHECRRT
jgi:hypothetical protein